MHFFWHALLCVRAMQACNDDAECVRLCTRESVVRGNVVRARFVYKHISGSCMRQCTRRQCLSIHTYNMLYMYNIFASFFAYLSVVYRENSSHTRTQDIILIFGTLLIPHRHEIHSKSVSVRSFNARFSRMCLQYQMQYLFPIRSHTDRDSHTRAQMQSHIHPQFPHFACVCEFWVHLGW